MASTVSNEKLLNLTKQEIQKIQFDILFTSTENNGYLSSSDNELLDKGLHTRNKRIIKSINEVLDLAESSIQSLNDFKYRFNTVLGDEITNPELLANIKTIDENVFKAIYTIYRAIQAGNIPGLDEKFNDLNTKLSVADSRLNILENFYNGLKDKSCFKYETITEELIPHNNILQCSYIPIKNENLQVFINGIITTNTKFSINKVNKTIEWTFNSSVPDGFDLDETDLIIVTYNYEKPSS